jgi:LuxR family maltose regulon positive regulatory protein
MNTPPDTAFWGGTPLTKFRIPRLRRDAVPRPALQARLDAAVDAHPVTIVSAPGGYGKSTLLAQWAVESLANPTRRIVWLAIDNDDNDTNRLFASLLRALEQLQLTWDSPPHDLLANATGTGTQQRAALATVVNALCTSTAQRLVIVFDDFHRIESSPTLELIESLVERLPDHVSLLFGTRVEPQLPLARWRVHGELAELTPADLEFSLADAVALAAAKTGVEPDASAVRDALHRTHGWAAGLSLVLQSRLAPRPMPGKRPASLEASDRHLYAYLAQEVLAELPDDLLDFVLQCSVLLELNPDLCLAVTGRDDSREVLEALYRRNLFLTAIDEQTPVLRFHDLFRDFLTGELERRRPGHARDLHERAGRVETSTPRAIAHFLAAERWEDAIVRILESGEPLLIEGGHATLERWIDSIPETHRAQHPQLGYLRGICAWLRWDWRRAKREFRSAIDGLSSPDQVSRRIRSMFLYVDALNSSGEAEGATAMLDEIARLPLGSIAQAQLSLQRAWNLAPLGEPEKVGDYFAEFVAYAAKDPLRVCPAAAERIHCVCIGLPRVAQSFDRYYELVEQIHPNVSAPWKLAALSVGAWAHFWHGRREEVQRLLKMGEALQHQFGGIRLVAERLLNFRALYLGAIGQSAAGIELTQSIIASLQSMEVGGHRAAWQRSYQHGLARQHWLAMDATAYSELLPQLLGPKRPAEWPFIDAATETARGHVALLNGDSATAIDALEKAVNLHARLRMPMTYADPRVALAYAQSTAGQARRAWQTFAPVYREATEEQAVGLLLLEPTSVIAALLALAPGEVRRTDAMASLVKRLDTWRPSLNEAPLASGPLAALSDREREVLEQVAAGASNKHIARDLSLSLHTVKRHIANILDKLDCASRGQAADLFRRHAS